MKFYIQLLQETDSKPIIIDSTSRILSILYNNMDSGHKIDTIPLTQAKRRRHGGFIMHPGHNDCKDVPSTKMFMRFFLE